MRRIKRYGWKNDTPDFRDKFYRFVPPVSASLPPLVDLRVSNEPAIYDQGQLGSCTANAIAALFEAEVLKQGLPDFTPSRLFIYYNERVIEGTVNSDDGAEIRDGFKSIATQGVCPEVVWPYDISQFAVKPDDLCYQDALLNTAMQYLPVTQDLNHIKACLADGYRLAFGISVFDSFESDEVAKTGIVPTPLNNESCLGGHAVACVGYSDDKQALIMRNSWGSSWGDKGYFYLPYNYATDPDLADSFWTVRLVS